MSYRHFVRDQLMRTLEMTQPKYDVLYEYHMRLSRDIQFAAFAASLSQSCHRHGRRV